jgi:hypothetical protein
MGLHDIVLTNKSECFYPITLCRYVQIANKPAHNISEKRRGKTQHVEKSGWTKPAKPFVLSSQKNENFNEIKYVYQYGPHERISQIAPNKYDIDK